MTKSSETSEETQEVLLPSGLHNLHAPVLIIGGGPTGLTTSYLLAKQGIPSIVAEKYEKRLGAPKAHALSPRSLEICRAAGLDLRELRQHGAQLQDARDVRFVMSLASSEDVGSLPYERMDVEVLDSTPEILHNIPQPDYEQLLVTKLQDMPEARIMRRLAFQECSDLADGSGIETILLDRESGNTLKITSQYVIGCDGARSKVRQHLGIPLEGEESVEAMITIHFHANIRHLVGGRTGILYWILDPAARGFVIAYHLGDEHSPANLVLIHNPGANVDIESLRSQPSKCEDIVRAAIGDDRIPFEIISTAPWMLSRQVAAKYRVGNCLLAGDAAHAFPPTGGLGLNSGIADAHNLVTKLAMILQGWAEPSLLDRYEMERRPVAVVNAEQSLKNGKAILQLLWELKTGSTDFAAQRLQLHQHLCDPAARAILDGLIEKQREHFDNLNLHLGYIYGDPAPPASASHFTPAFVPGGRLPHAWIDLKAQNIKSARTPVDLAYAEGALPGVTQQFRAARAYSTLDLVSDRAITILSRADSNTGKDLQGQLETQKVPVNHLRWPGDFDMAEERTSGGQNGADSVRSTTASMSCCLRFETACFKEAAGIIVRPDQHIIIRFRETDEVARLVQIVRKQLRSHASRP